VERTWHEINQRVVYLIKEILVEYTMRSLIDNENQTLMNILGILVRKLVTQGMNIFVLSWNHHRIRGPCKGIPEELATHSPITPLPESEIPEIVDLVNEYNYNGGAINANLENIEAFQNEVANTQFINYINSIDFDYIYIKVINGDREILLRLLNESVDVYSTIFNSYMQ
jgi:hypothetical protein